MAYKENLQQTMGGYQPQQQWQQPQQQYGQPMQMQQPLPPHQMEQIYNMVQHPQKNDDYNMFVNFLKFQKQVDFVNNLVAGGIVKLPNEKIIDGDKEESSTFSKIFTVAVGVGAAIAFMGVMGNV